MPDILTEAEVAARYRIHVRTLRRRIAAWQVEHPEFQPMRPGRGMVFNAADLQVLEAIFRRKREEAHASEPCDVARSDIEAQRSLRRQETKRLLRGLRVPE